MTMEIYRHRAYARAGLVGNPSDGYAGKTISAIVRNFHAEVVLYEWEELEIVRTHHDESRFLSVRELVQDVTLHGYGGGIRLLKATIRRFVDFCDTRGYRLRPENFSLRYETNIPRQVGLAGSSAIIVATLRCLMDFYDVRIPREVLPSFVLSIETEELGIAAGLQDRVIQCYEGLVAMDFGPEAMTDKIGYKIGSYEPLDAATLPPLYLAYSADRSEPTEVVHNDLRSRYQAGDAKVLAAMQRFRELTDEARDAIDAQDTERLGRVMDANFDLRRSICPIAKAQLEMVERARSVGVPAKFAGSGGAIVGTLPPHIDRSLLRAAMREIKCEVITPDVG